ncbi:MAG: 2-amino-4-hydroxy-6-hydroxymethyldihydropteridine diphosphokinase [Bacteroidetes bacterium]|nr:2-amino-4-hydroxy-6-hydroxymethyldihydropteridine diphosphokinase [Bacteroidota bacterium]
MSTTILSLGSNLGDREEHISRALSLLSEKAGILISVSKPYYSEAMGYVSKHEFCNVCAKYSTALKPLELLQVCQAIELEMGRVKDSKGYLSDRIIDIDILFFDDITLVSEELTIPHPRWSERPFVMRPLTELM